VNQTPPPFDPLISIIMAVKNTAIYLEDCINSILLQSCTNWELIAVNDHSTDNSLIILKQFAAKDSRIKIYNGKGHKVTPTLIEAYGYSTGTLITRMDSDDKMPKYKLEVLYNEWQKYDMGTVVTGGTEYFVDEGEVGGGFRRYDAWLRSVAKHNTYAEEIYTECVIPSNCWLIHRRDFEMVGGFVSHIYPEDYDLCFRFYKAKLNIIGLCNVVHHWRDRPDRISRTLEEYKDNRYFHLKILYFYDIDRDRSRPLVLWGVGRNGKDLAKLILKKEKIFYWVCDNEKKIGKNIYGIQIQHFDVANTLDNPQIIIAIASPDAKPDIKGQLKHWGKGVVTDYWFFV